MTIITYQDSQIEKSRELPITVRITNRPIYRTHVQRSTTNLIQVPILNQLSPNPNSIPAAQSTANHNSNTLRHTSKSKVKMLHLNARSLKNRENLHQIRELTRAHKPGVLAISESWLNSKVRNAEVEIDGYKLFRLDRLHKPGGGVCAYVRTDIKSQKLNHLSQTLENNFQQLWLHLQLNKCKSLAICVAYRPPNCPLHCFDSTFKPAYIEALLLKNPIVIMGDLNCSMLNTNVNSESLTNPCKELNLIQVIKSPTRITATSESLIDVILVSNPKLTKSSGVFKTLISDHYPVCISLKLKVEKTCPQIITERSYLNYTPELFAMEMAQHT